VKTIKTSELDDSARTLILVELGKAFIFDDAPPDPRWVKDQALEILSSDGAGSLVCAPDGRPWLSPAFVHSLATAIRLQMKAAPAQAAERSGSADPGEVAAELQDQDAPRVPDWKGRPR